MGRPDGLTKLVLDPASERVLGMGVVGVGAGELIAEGVLAVEMAALATDLRLTIHPASHPERDGHGERRPVLRPEHPPVPAAPAGEMTAPPPDGTVRLPGVRRRIRRPYRSLAVLPRTGHRGSSRRFSRNSLRVVGLRARR